MTTYVSKPLPIWKRVRKVRCRHWPKSPVCVKQPAILGSSTRNYRYHRAKPLPFSVLLKNYDRADTALVFSQFTSHLALIREALDKQEIPYLYLDGSTTPSERNRLVRQFQTGDEPLFLISLKAGGLGLNLTAADYVIHLDPWWNPAIEDQASDRAHRIGQERPVTVYRLIAAGTIEEKIIRLHQNKRSLADALLQNADMFAQISADDVIRLLREGVDDIA